MSDKKHGCRDCLAYCRPRENGMSECIHNEVYKGFVIRRKYIRPEMKEGGGYKCPRWTAIPPRSRISSVFLRWDWRQEGRRIEIDLEDDEGGMAENG